MEPENDERSRVINLLTHARTCRENLDRLVEVTAARIERGGLTIGVLTDGSTPPNWVRMLMIQFEDAENDIGGAARVGSIMHRTGRGFTLRTLPFPKPVRGTFDLSHDTLFKIIAYGGDSKILKLRDRRGPNDSVHLPL